MAKDKVLKGDHLTVIKKPNGEIALEWDWDALLKQVVEATGAKKTTKKKTKK